MKPQTLLALGIVPALQALEEHGVRDTPEARRFLLTIALQESALRYRRQVDSNGLETGPAASYWQFEKGGGCKGVLIHSAATGPMHAVCKALDVAATPQALWDAMRYNDVLAAAAARLLVRTLPYSLPMTADEGWRQYLAAWRPGQPHPSRWPDAWEVASRAVGVKA